MPAPFSVRILETRVLAKAWSTLTSYVIAYTRRDGREERLIREVNDHGHAASVLARDPDRGTVLLVRQMRIAAWIAGHTEPLLEACAGLLDGDDPEACALREGEEELGYRLTDPRHICDCFVSPGSLTERVSLFLAHYSPQDRLHGGGGVAHEGEDIEVVEMPLADALAMVASGGIVDAKTIILLQALAMMTSSPFMGEDSFAAGEAGGGGGGEHEPRRHFPHLPLRGCPPP